jgi:hypothetical protein
MCPPGHLAAVVFSHASDGEGVCKTLAGITNHDSQCPRFCCIGSKPGDHSYRYYLHLCLIDRRAKVELRGWETLCAAAKEDKTNARMICMACLFEGDGLTEICPCGRPPVCVTGYSLGSSSASSPAALLSKWCFSAGAQNKLFLSRWTSQ